MKYVAAFGLLAVLVACRPGQAVPSPAPGPTDAVVAQGTAGFARPLAEDRWWPAELPIGVQLFEADVETPALDHLRNAGIAWARARALWKAIEPEHQVPPRYDWQMSDRLLGATTAAGFRNVVVVYANPPWAADSECGPVRPERMADYAAFWSALVERYDGDGEADAPEGAVAHIWQVSNEVDFDPTAVSAEADYGGCFGNDPAAYAEQLAVAYRAIKAADPGAQVGFGPVAYDRFTVASAPPGWTGSPGPFVHDFTQRALEHLYRHHPADKQLPFFDFVAIHNYNDNADQWDRPPLREMLGRISAFRNEQLALPGFYDLRRMPLVVSETGLAASPSDEWTERSEALQAAYVAQTFVRAMAVGAVAAIWYSARDSNFGDCVPPHWDWLTFGLMRSADFRLAIEERCPLRDFHLDYRAASSAEPRPALTALAVLARQMRGARFEGLVEAAATGCADCEVYRFRLADDRPSLVAWATNGQRLGRRGLPAPTARLRIDESMLAPWSGWLAVTDHLGGERVVAQADDGAVELDLGVAPVYLAPAEAPGSRASSHADPLRRR